MPLSNSELRNKSRKVISEFLPPESVEAILDLNDLHPFHLTITNPRTTKLGDYRSPQRGDIHRITVNGNLNPYQFLVTLLHEIAHLTTYEKYKNRVLPHGNEWKKEFRDIAWPFLRKDIFPEEIINELGRYLINPAASSCADDGLLLIMRKYDARKAKTIVDIPTGELFGMPPRIFKKGELMRKRYKCLDVVNKKWYMVHPQAEVHDIPEEVLIKIKGLGLV